MKALVLAIIAYLKTHNLFMIVTGDDVAITAGAHALSCTTDRFKAQDVGKAICIEGAGATGADLTTTIATFVDATHITVTAAAGTTVSDADMTYAADVYEAEDEDLEIVPTWILLPRVKPLICIGVKDGDIDSLDEELGLTYTWIGKARIAIWKEMTPDTTLTPSSEGGIHDMMEGLKTLLNNNKLSIADMETALVVKEGEVEWRASDVFSAHRKILHMRYQKFVA